MATITATGETRHSYGKTPHGVINYGRDGRMLTLVVNAERPAPAALAKITDKQRVDLYNTMFAYGGSSPLTAKTLDTT